MERWTSHSSVRPGFVLVATTMLLMGGLMSTTPTAMADKCKSEDHAACNSHDCPRDGQKHKHVHNVHWWRDHGCERDPACCAETPSPSPRATLPCVENPVFEACILDGALYWDIVDFTPSGPAPPPLDILDRGFDCVFFELDAEWCARMTAALVEEPVDELRPPVVYHEGRLIAT